MPIPTYGWSDERVERMKFLLLQGKSMTGVAIEIFGTPDARNAVCGKHYRLKLLDLLPAELRELRAKSDAQRRLHARPRVRRPARPRVKLAPLPAIEFSPPNPATRCTLLELKGDSCRFPIGDPSTADFRFCGSPGATFPGPYCAHCMAFLYPAQRQQQDLACVA
jgi:GcrA cell cycle regulator